MHLDSLKIEQELVAIALRTQPRGLLNGLVFAGLTVVLVWPSLPHPYLLAWAAGFVTLAAARMGISREFAASPQPVPDPRQWLRRAAFGYGATGLAWGTLGAACFIMAPHILLYTLWVVFLVAYFAVLASQTTASHPWVFRSFLLAAMAPIIAVSVIFEGQNYWLRLIAEAMFLSISLLAGRTGNRYVTDSIRMRFENLELLRDLGEQKDAVERANAAKTRFLAAASHDLRQPMQALVLLVESLQDRVKDPTNRHIAESIHSTVESMSVLLNEILDLSRLEAGTVSPQRSSFPIATVLDRLRAAYTYPAARRDLALRVHDSECVVSTDPILLYRILVNLVENALRYTRSGGVLIACRQRREGLWIEVWDTGIGIPEDQRDAIFQEFHQLGNPHRDREQGFGLGLAIVERTARLLGLPLELRSRVGRGSVFRLRLPYGDPLQVRASAPERPPAALTGSRVLVVEDDVEIRSAMLLLLEGWGCEVHSASSGEELDRALAAGPPDALIADFRLPGKETGIDVVLRVRERFPRTFGILVSGDVTPAVLRAAREASIDLLHKPLKPARLRALLGAMRTRLTAVPQAVPAKEGA